MPLPASSSKHLDLIIHSIPRDTLLNLSLKQLSADSQGTSTGTTGTTLWLGGQVLSAYLCSLTPPASSLSPISNTITHYVREELSQNPETLTKVAGEPTPFKEKRRKVVELGAGIGYLSLVLASMGYDVVSTDIPPVLDSVLRPNVQNGLEALKRTTKSTFVFPSTGPSTLSSNHADPENARASNMRSGNGRVPVRREEAKRSIGNINSIELDWTKIHSVSNLMSLDLEVDMIVTSDTIYTPDLLPHLFRTIRLISEISTSGGTRKAPVIYLCLERRDGRMVDSALKLAGKYELELKRIGQGRVGKSVRESGWGWKDEDWEGVEVYKGRWSGTDIAA